MATQEILLGKRECCQGIRLGQMKLIDESDSAYNDMCYLCEKYAPLEGLGKYDSGKDPSVTGARIQVHT